MGRVESLYTEIEKQPSASVKPVINHGLNLDGLGPTRSALYLFIPKAFKEKECLTLFLRLSQTDVNPRLTCFNLLLP
ncbi:hypothetical protein GCM10023339_69900 [Alloalcanivorax gelatiniphagus]